MAKYDPIDQAARDREQQESDERARNAQERDDKDLRWLMSSRQGRRVAWRMLDRAGVTVSSFNPNALQMAFNEGFRNYGNWMLARILEVCPESYSEMLKEKADERNNTSGNGPKPN